METIIPKYRLIEENEEFIIVDKPADLLTHGSDHQDEASLIDQILIDYPEIAKIGDDPARPGIMQRLDKLASGLLVIARTEESFENLKKQFQERKTKKHYFALVFGKTSKDYDEIDFPIKRSTKGYKMAALPKSKKGEAQDEGRRAFSSFEVIQRFINYTLLDVRIKTGRTHQVRVHMAAYGHPLVGDDTYGTAKTRLKNKKLGLGRIFLQARYLSFNDLSGNKRSYELDLAPELQTFLKKIK